MRLRLLLLSLLLQLNLLQRSNHKLMLFFNSCELFWQFSKLSSSLPRNQAVQLQFQLYFFTPPIVKPTSMSKFNALPLPMLITFYRSMTSNSDRGTNHIYDKGNGMGHLRLEKAKVSTVSIWIELKPLNPAEVAAK